MSKNNVYAYFQGDQTKEDSVVRNVHEAEAEGDRIITPYENSSTSREWRVIE